MRLSDSRSEARFRAELIAWLDEHQPAADRVSDPPRSSGHIPVWASDWQRTLFDAGWLVPRWPAELGGRDASAIEQIIYLEELSRRRLPRTVNPQGLDVCAPTLADHGIGPQADEWVVAILRGETSWCIATDGVTTIEQAEPGGSLATAEAGAGPTLAETEGGMVLRGSVPAPPGAPDADRCLCAVRVEPAGRGGDPVAVVAVDLRAPGVSRPDGTDDDLAFGGVAVTEADVVGGRDRSRSVLQSLRARTRSLRWITSLLAIERGLEALGDVVRSRGLADDAAVRDRVAGLQVEADAVRALAYRALARKESGRPNPELAMLPLATAQTEERIYLTGLDALGADGLDMGMEGPMGWPSGSWASEWANATETAAASGGLGAERDRVAGRVLGTHLH